MKAGTLPDFASFWSPSPQQALNKYLLNKWANGGVSRIWTSYGSEYSLVWVETQQSTGGPTDLLFAFCFPILLQPDYLSLPIVLIPFCWEKAEICNTKQWLKELENFLFLCDDLYSDYSDFNSWPDRPTSARWSLLLDWRPPVAVLFSECEKPSTDAKTEVSRPVVQYPRGIPFSNHYNKLYWNSL